MHFLIGYVLHYIARWYILRCAGKLFRKLHVTCKSIKAWNYYAIPLTAIIFLFTFVQIQEGNTRLILMNTYIGGIKGGLKERSGLEDL